MTKEDILRTLKSILAEINESENAVCYVTSEDREVIKSAIKALEQEPCKCFTCKYGEWKRKGWDITMADDKCGGCCSWNYKYEPLEQEPKTGEWQQDLDGTYLCSECGSGFKEQPTFMGKPMFLWCPLCGCRMESEDNE